MRRPALLVGLLIAACRPSIEVELGDAEWFTLIELADGGRAVAADVSLGPLQPVAAFPPSIARAAPTLVLLFDAGSITEAVNDSPLFVAGPCDPPVTATGQLRIVGGQVEAPEPPVLIPPLSASWASASRCAPSKSYVDPNSFCVGPRGEDDQACTVELTIDGCCARVSFAARAEGASCPDPVVGVLEAGVLEFGAEGTSACEGEAALDGLAGLQLRCSRETTCTALFGSGIECGADLGDCEDPIGVCETDLRSTDAHCGACGMSCPADRFCGAGRCLCVEEGRDGTLTPLADGALGPSEAPSIGEGPGGPVVAFSSLAMNLVPGAGDGRTARVFVSTPAGLEVLHDLEAEAPRVSPNGRYVVFESTAPDVTPTARVRVATDRESGRVDALDVVESGGAVVVAIARARRLVVRSCRAACSTLPGTETTTDAEDLRAYARADGRVEVIVAGRDRIRVTECTEQGCAPLVTLAEGPFSPGLDLAHDGSTPVVLARREGSLTLLRCASGGCYAGADRRDLPFRQDGAALSFDAGRPVLAYLRDRTLGRLVCRDPTCSSFDAAVVADPAFGARAVFGDPRHLAYLGPDATAYIVKCLDDICGDRVTRSTSAPAVRAFDLTVRGAVWSLVAETDKGELWLEVGLDEAGGLRHRSWLESGVSGPRLGRPPGEGARVVFEDGGVVKLFECLDERCETNRSGSRRRIYLHDRSTGVTMRASVEPTGEDVSRDAHSAVVADDGRVAFVRDDRPFSRLFTFDPARRATRALADEVLGPVEAPAIAADGSVVAFTSRAGLTLDAPPRERVLFVDLATDALGEVPATGPSRRPSLSADGRRVAFETAPGAPPYPHQIELRPGESALYGTRRRTGPSVYAPVRDGVLHVAVCSGAACPELARATPVGAVGSGRIAVAQGASRGPVLAYPTNDGGERAIVHRRCLDAGCATLTAPEVLVTGEANTLVGAFVDSADQARVFFRAGADLHEVVCADVTCAGVTPRVAAIGVGQAALARGSSRAVLLTSDEANLTLRRLDAGGVWKPVVVASDVVGEAAVEVGPDGRPVVVFGRAGVGGVELFAVRCADPACGSLTAPISLGTVEGSRRLELMITNDDRLVVAAGDTRSGELSLIVCQDATCRDVERAAVDNRVGGDVSAFLGPDGTPWISFQVSVDEGAQRSLRLVCGSLTCEDPVGEPDHIAVADRESGRVDVVSLRPDGGAIVEPARWPRLSPNGRFVAFASADPGLGPAICSGASHVFRVDLDSGDVLRMSLDGRGREGAGDSVSPDVASSGAVVFESYAENFLAPGLFTRVVPQVYLRR